MFSVQLRRSMVAVACFSVLFSFGASVGYARPAVPPGSLCERVDLRYRPEQTVPPAEPVSVTWPAPQNLEVEVIQPTAPPMPIQVRVLPNFNAPSATSCNRLPVMREVGGRQGVQDVRRGSARGTGSVSDGKSLAEEYEPMLERASLSSMVPEASSVAMERVTPAPSAPVHPDVMQQQLQPVTAGMVDDNADFGEFLAFLKRNAQVEHRVRDVSERHLLQVRDEQGRSVPDAEVAITSPQGYSMWARTDAGGRVWVHPNVFDTGKVASEYQVYVRKDGRTVQGVLRRGARSALEMVLPGVPVAQRAQLDLVFLVDSTGSMDDEIAKLRESLKVIVAEMSQLPSQPDLCLGLVTYRDKGDAYLLRSYDMTNDINAFQRVLDGLQASAGGDTPEAMNEAFNETVHNLSWRGNGTTRMVVLLADAPPHLDYGGPQYDDDMVAALGMGIKVFSVGASGLDTQGELIQRQIAQYTGGRFVFLTYADANNPSSGAGRETVHDVRNYSVSTLDSLIVRLVREELGLLPNSK